MMQIKNSNKIALLIIALIITVYGGWCIWDYYSLVGSWLWPKLPLYIVPIIGIWMGWSGLWNTVTAGQDWDRSVGYMKIMGGAALIVITNLFLYVMAQ
jgi:hypothetical protein